MEDACRILIGTSETETDSVKLGRACEDNIEMHLNYV